MSFEWISILTPFIYSYAPLLYYLPYSFRKELKRNGRSWRRLQGNKETPLRSLLPHAHLTQCSHTLLCYGFMSINSLLSLSTHICSLPTQWKCKSYRKANFQFYCDLITNFTIKLRLSPLYLIIIWRYLNTFLPRALRYSRESIYGLSLSLFWL